MLVFSRELLATTKYRKYDLVLLIYVLLELFIPFKSSVHKLMKQEIIKQVVFRVLVIFYKAIWGKKAAEDE